MRSTTLKVLAGIVLTTALVWMLVLGWWQANDFQPSKSDLLLYLFFPPFALVGGFLLLRGFIEHLKAPPRKEAANKEIKDDDPLASANAKTSAAERQYSICLVGAWLNASPGKTAAEMLENIEAGIRPGPSKHRHDDEGFPVFLAEVEDLDIEQFSDLLETDSKLRALVQSPQRTRLLALIDSVLPEAEIQIREALDNAPASARLQIHWLLPGTIENTHFPAMRGWLNDNYLSNIDKNRLDIKMTPVGSEAGALKYVDDVVLQINREQLDNDLFLVIAASSAVDEDSIQLLGAHKRLFSANNQNGQIPGEAAVALLFSSQKTATSLGADDVVLVSRTSHASRDKSVDSAGRVSGTLIEHLVDGLLDIHAIEASSVEALVSDTDHRANRIGEVMAGLGSRFEHLDPIKDCLATGTSTGSNPPTGSLLALACARKKALTTEGPVFCISNQHDTERAVVLAIPFVAQVSTETTST